ncbi:hypothetical protein L6Q21_17075 [Sandaracinobacter sp. RS1-74]|uniref:hypothetical protein n=1 Tax=Sandaracinobacteroides sayramensis TaxID=2913411 RepID=UPI001EDBE09C|nr:hypothetical protein [Sandaracinobacteroides sayramensis]MCG2842690.1 hypothetical protein [Sandaracinobacteroides sayramensis]
MQWMLGLALVAAPLAFAAPALAQDGSYRSRTVVVFGDDPCPKANNPDEIIVCARRPEEERYRIPKALREEEKAAAIARQDQVGANRAALASGQNSATGIGSCSTVGSGGVIGCTRGLDIVGGARTAVEGVKTAIEPTDE